MNILLNTCIRIFNQTQDIFPNDENSEETILIILPDEKKENTSNLNEEELETDNIPQIKPESVLEYKDLNSDQLVKQNKSGFNYLNLEHFVEGNNLKLEHFVEANQSGLNHLKSENSLIFDDFEQGDAKVGNFMSQVVDKDGLILKSLLNKVSKKKYIKIDEVFNLEDEESNELNLKFSCTMCLETFNSKLELKKHTKSHPEESRHICKICFKSYRKLSILKRHMITHSGNKLYKCYECDKSFYHRNALRAHTRYHQDRQYACKVCRSKFYFRYKLIEHLNEAHAKEFEEFGEDLVLIGSFINQDIKDDPVIHEVKVEYDCTMCSQSFDNESALNLHKMSHPDGSRHVCRVCGRSYLEAGTLKRHNIMHTGKKTHLCTVCGKAFYYKNVLKAHMIYHSEKKHACRSCDKKFYTGHYLAEHVRLAHSDNKYNFICEVCGKLCSSRSRLILHRSSHSTKKYCVQCGKTYKNLRYYKDHMKRHKGVIVKKNEFICDYCGESRSLKSLLELHILSNHLKERRFNCEVCGKGFFSKGSLKEHGIVHTKERPEQCNMCGRRLINKKALVLHQRLHTGERPFQCSVCGERFLSSSRRHVHMKNRHGERIEHLHTELNKHFTVHVSEDNLANLDEVPKHIPSS